MTINLISDLHGHVDNLTNEVIFRTGFDFNKLKPADVLVIAGDLTYIGDNYQAVHDYIMNHEAVKANFKDVIIIKGNHDFATSGYDVVPEFNPLDDQWNFTKVCGNTMFICTPMFTPIDPATRYYYGGYLDFRYIPQWTVEANNETYEKCVKFIYDTYEANKDKYDSFVVVTHHCPSDKLILKKYIGDRLNPAFTVMSKHPLLDKLKRAKKIKYWMHGHTHAKCSRKINKLRYLRNPIGYAFRYGIGDGDPTNNHLLYNECNFKYDFIVEI